MGPRVSLYEVEKRKFLTLPGLQLRRLGCPVRSQWLYRLSYPGSSLYARKFCNSNGIRFKNRHLSDCTNMGLERDYAVVKDQFATPEHVNKVVSIIAVIMLPQRILIRKRTGIIRGF
jgi:hypothetical protein